MASPGKRCLYEVLGLSRDCAAEEIRSAYKRAALQRHPDKLVQSGVPEAEATAGFQELVNAYEVLSDPRERAWYDSHRNQILFSSTAASSGSSSSSSFVPDLFSFFSNSVYSGYSDLGRGFYKVYGDLFEKIYTSELNFAKKLGLPLPKEAPGMGKLESPYVQVTAFYNHWLGFGTVLDFFWADKYDVAAGMHRKARRVMEEENKKLRKRARREYNETVRGLAEFVKKRDKRVIDMQVKRSEEMERKREEEKQRKKELERQKAEKARNYEEPEWAKDHEAADDDNDDDVVVEEEKKNELYCVVCSKKFKSDKQWKNHEQSKKHKEKVAELREAFSEQDREFEGYEKEDEVDGNGVCYLSSADDWVQQQFEQGDDNDDGKAGSSYSTGGNGVGSELGSDDDDDEASVLEAMLSGRKSRNNKVEKIEVGIDDSSDELEFMEYNDTKGSRRNKGGMRRRRRRRRRGARQEEEEEEVEVQVVEEEKEEEVQVQVVEETETMKADAAETNGEHEEHDRRDNDDVGETSSHTLPESETKSRIDDNSTERGDNNPQQAVNKKYTKKKEKNTPKLKENTKEKENTKKEKTSKGRKQKGAANGSDNICEKCGAEFESRTKLHKHLGDTGHATIKSR